jgi:hypothetical protein
MMGAWLGYWLLELSYSPESFAWPSLIKPKDRQTLGHVGFRQMMLYSPSME